MMTKNLVVCCDGTGNQIEGNFSNVLKLFRILHKNQSNAFITTPGSAPLTLVFVRLTPVIRSHQDR